MRTYKIISDEDECIGKVVRRVLTHDDCVFFFYEGDEVSIAKISYSCVELASRYSFTPSKYNLSDLMLLEVIDKSEYEVLKKKHLEDDASKQRSMEIDMLQKLKMKYES